MRVGELPSNRISNSAVFLFLHQSSMKLTIEWSREEIEQFLGMRIIEWVPMPDTSIPIIVPTEDPPQAQIVPLPKEKKPPKSQGGGRGTRAKMIEVFEKDNTGNWNLKQSCKSVSEAAKYVGANFPASISPHVDKGTVYKDKYKFITRIDRVDIAPDIPEDDE